MEARVEELVEQNERDRTEYQEREDWLKKKIDTQALMLEDKRPKEEEQPESSDRWLVYGLGAFTMIIGLIAVVAIYYLLQGGL